MINLLKFLFPAVQETAFKEMLIPPGRPAALQLINGAGTFARHPLEWLAFIKRFVTWFVAYYTKS